MRLTPSGSDTVKQCQDCNDDQQFVISCLRHLEYLTDVSWSSDMNADTVAYRTK